MLTILRWRISPAQNKAVYYRRSYIQGDHWTGSFLDSSKYDLIFCMDSYGDILWYSRYQTKVRWWPLHAEWHIHLRADSAVWLSHTSSIWPWSGTPKSTFVQYICKLLTSDVAVFGLIVLARLKEVRKDLVENLDVSELFGWIGTLDPHQVPTQNTHSYLVPEGRLECILVRGKPVASGCLLCLQDMKIGPIDWW